MFTHTVSLQKWSSVSWLQHPMCIWLPQSAVYYCSLGQWSSTFLVHSPKNRQTPVRDPPTWLSTDRTVNFNTKVFCIFPFQASPLVWLLQVEHTLHTPGTFMRTAWKGLAIGSEYQRASIWIATNFETWTIILAAIMS